MFTTSLFVALAALASTAAARLGHAHHAHSHAVRAELPSEWEHSADHPVHALFARQDATTTTVVPGTPAWVASFPGRTIDSKAMPQPWKDSLAAAVAGGKIPNYPQSIILQGNAPKYPDGVDPNSKTSVCSASYGCRIDSDLWDAPDGMFGVSFDDGPDPQFSPRLYQFLEQTKQKVTHFMIGVNIVADVPGFKFAFETLKDDIAVHTWTHPYMTSLSNEDVVAQLGYTIAAIRDLSGGRIARFWRPPFGDTDARVSAIAKEVFGLTTVIWNRDTRDWEIVNGATTLAAVSTNFQEWIKGPKTPGLIVLEHESSNDTVSNFIDNYPSIVSAGWKIMPVTSNAITGGAPYRNAEDNEAPVESLALALAPSGSAVASSTTVAGPVASDKVPVGGTVEAGVPTVSQSTTVVDVTSKAVPAPTNVAAAATKDKAGAAGALVAPSVFSLALLALPFIL